MTQYWLEVEEQPLLEVLKKRADVALSGQGSQKHGVMLGLGDIIGLSSLSDSMLVSQVLTWISWQENLEEWKYHIQNTSEDSCSPSCLIRTLEKILSKVSEVLYIKLFVYNFHLSSVGSRGLKWSWKLADFCGVCWNPNGGLFNGPVLPNMGNFFFCFFL